jgi:hypothetical protein
MVTLISYGNSEGTRRCDARCYDAGEGTACECICGGKNHAAGKKKAVEQTRELADQWLEEYCQQEGISKEDLEFKLHHSVRQGDLLF